MTSFQAFYDATTKHRKLAWAHAVGGALLKGAFDARPLELQLATMQAAGLMLFNAAPGETLSYVEARRGGGRAGGGGGRWAGQRGGGRSVPIPFLPAPPPRLQFRDRLNVSDEDANRVLHSLSCAKHKARGVAGKGRGRGYGRGGMGGGGGVRPGGQVWADGAGGRLPRPTPTPMPTTRTTPLPLFRS